MILAPAIDLVLSDPPTVMFEAPTLPAPLPPDVPPAPGDPEVPLPAPVPRGHLRRWSVHVAHPITHAPVTTFYEASVKGWSDPIGLEQGSIDGVALSVWDEAWRQFGGPSKMIRGRRCYYQDPTGYEVFLGMDGRTVATGVILSADGDGDMKSLRIGSPVAVFQHRQLGDGGIGDLLGGRGRFPTPSLAGFETQGLAWDWDGTDPFEGARSLRVRRSGAPGPAFLRGPWITVQADRYVWIGVRTQVMVRGAKSTAAVGISTEVQTLAGQVIDAEWSAAHAQGTDSDVATWQQIVSTGHLPLGTGWFRVRAVIPIVSNDWVDIDMLTYAQEGMTGSLTPIDLAQYVQLVMREAQSVRSGGDLGIPVVVRESAGAKDIMRWEHQNDPDVLECLMSLADRTDGPEMWFATDWAMRVARRQGADRRDLALTDSTVIDWSVSVDDTARFDDLRVSTGYGAGPSRVALAFDTPAPGRRSRRTTVRAPNELSYRSTEKWGAGHAEYLARRQEVLSVTVTLDEGLRFATGDGVWAALSNGASYVDGPFRVGDRQFDVAAETCVLSLGADPKVRL